MGAAQRHVQRARRTLTTARATGNPTAIQHARDRLTAAKRRLADTHAAYPLSAHQQGHDTHTAPEAPMPSQPTPEPAATGPDEHSRTGVPPQPDNTPAHRQGHDTTPTPPASNTSEDQHSNGVRVVNTGTHVGLRTDGDVHGATVVMGTSTSTQPPAGIPRAARNALAHAQRLREQAHTHTTTTTNGTNQQTTVQHADGTVTVHNYATGTVGIQSATDHGNTVHID
ncbi:hypothetical protein ABZ639_27055 [Saccharomonospora sp. NPDC006951]